ncbi:PGN_0703 family putative restriction endonuclease [Polaromonas naphthalenivorans]|uniref:PD-(D/E)XK nuclease-like domain-containing protein n=1 Tax=Polaromonas naphthalenivorans (strain CJ2) TaxID=365044 RepID=A1VWK3_POLNA|nr:hypothetical protein [Polaromonas naphthalenivorans]ABM40031.1 hypothetical protein Pnap_4970 [Polaromonas naphthalenivorans CJ2]
MGTLRDLVGSTMVDRDSAYVRRMRFHQGWWRAFVLNEEQGPRSGRPAETVCNALPSIPKALGNFLSEAAQAAALKTVEERKSQGGAGLMDVSRLFGNLLSSQPLAFNFFGEFTDGAGSLALATAIFSQFVALDEVTKVCFEFAPGKPSGDNSAYDAAIEYTLNGKKGLVGIECKFTDSFSAEPYDKESYQKLYDASQTFDAAYEMLMAPRFNQLFRNQLLAEGFLKNADYNMVHTWLFCHPMDNAGKNTGDAFEQFIRGNAQTSFQVVTYDRFIAAAQQLDLSWKQREWTMLLWARYCATALSDEAFVEQSASA